MPEEILVFPNPNTGNFFITFPEEQPIVEIYNSLVEKLQVEYLLVSENTISVEILLPYNGISYLRSATRNYPLVILNP